MSINVDLIEAKVYKTEPKSDYTTYKIKIDCLRYGFVINGMKVIVYHHTGQYKVYKPSSPIGKNRFVSHIEFPNDSDFAKALVESCLRAIENDFGLNVSRLESKIS